MMIEMIFKMIHIRIILRNMRNSADQFKDNLITQDKVTKIPEGT